MGRHHGGPHENKQRKPLEEQSNVDHEGFHGRGSLNEISGEKLGQIPGALCQEGCDPDWNRTRCELADEERHDGPTGDETYAEEKGADIERVKDEIPAVVALDLFLKLFIRTFGINTVSLKQVSTNGSSKSPADGGG